MKQNATTNISTINCFGETREINFIFRHKGLNTCHNDYVSLARSSLPSV